MKEAHLYGGPSAKNWKLLSVWLKLADRGGLLPLLLLSIPSSSLSLRLLLELASSGCFVRSFQTNRSAER